MGQSPSKRRDAVCPQKSRVAQLVYRNWLKLVYIGKKSNIACKPVRDVKYCQTGNYNYEEVAVISQKLSRFVGVKCVTCAIKMGLLTLSA